VYFARKPQRCSAMFAVFMARTQHHQQVALSPEINSGHARQFQCCRKLECDIAMQTAPSQAKLCGAKNYRLNRLLGEF